MAQSAAGVYLGYVDELVSEKHKNAISFATNKIGGQPDYPSNINFDNPICPLCQLPRPLIVQIYAPLENAIYHRILYIFACINPNCWNHSESWCCIKVQTLEPINNVYETPTCAKPISNVADWCQDADDWDDKSNANINEENGNLINNSEKVSDEDDESYSFEDSIRIGLETLTVDDRNANTGGTPEAQGGAVGRLHSPAATAEIEGDEGEVISIDTPTFPQRDIAALLHEVTPLPQELCQKAKSDHKKCPIQFVSYFINVWEEANNAANLSDHHIRELLQEYQKNNDYVVTPLEMEPQNDGGCLDGATIEKYEKGIPQHGDRMFHYFLMKIQMNQGQILRYSRESTSPLLLYPIQDIPRNCQYCHGDMVFELQILPTLISKLHLTSDPKETTRLEFGNVLIFTCQRSCWSTDATFHQEMVITQAEVY
ncbi:putative programmed cell death protein 2-like [Trypoxylus dichotomus]